MLNNPMQNIFIVGDVNQLRLENTESIFNLKQMVKNPLAITIFLMYLQLISLTCIIPHWFIRVL
jgi:hypothetical protein